MTADNVRKHSDDADEQSLTAEDVGHRSTGRIRAENAFSVTCQ